VVPAALGPHDRRLRPGRHRPPRRCSPAAARGGGPRREPPPPTAGRRPDTIGACVKRAARKRAFPRRRQGPGAAGSGDARHSCQRHRCHNLQPAHPRKVVKLRAGSRPATALLPERQAGVRNGRLAMAERGTSGRRQPYRLASDIGGIAEADALVAPGVRAWVSGKLSGRVYPLVLAFLITKVTNVGEVRWTVPVTSQHPSVGQVTPLDWKSVARIRPGHPLAGAGPARRRRPVMCRRPGAVRHHPNFMPTRPRRSRKSPLAAITPCGHSPPTQSFPLPYELPQPRTPGADPEGPTRRASS
jgi:hypothetical protein